MPTDYKLFDRQCNLTMRMCGHIQKHTECIPRRGMCGLSSLHLNEKNFPPPDGKQL